MDDPNREKHEKDLAETIRAFFDEQRAELEDIDNLEMIATDSYWADTREAFIAAVFPLFLAYQLLAAIRLVDDTLPKIEEVQSPNLDKAVRQSAKEQAEEQADLFIEGIQQRAVKGNEENEELSEVTLMMIYLIYLWMQEHETDDLIAVTANTASVTKGEIAAVSKLQDLLVRRAKQYPQEPEQIMKGYWFTMLDEKVCPICQPNHGRPIEIVGVPPAHPRCRCYIQWRLGLL